MQKTVVIKIGSSTAITARGKLDGYRFAQIAKQVQELQQAQFGVVFVVSGAVKCGAKYARSSSKELLASIGQAQLIHQLVEVFENAGIAVGQMLLTKKDLQQKREHIQKIIHEAIVQHIVLIFNENDCIELNSFSGNDFLAAEIAVIVSAKHLLLLTDVDGVYNREMHVLKEYSDSCSIGNIHGKSKGIGGITSKIKAAKLAAQNNIETVIANGKEKNILQRILLDNEQIGTKFTMSSRTWYKSCKPIVP